MSNPIFEAVKKALIEGEAKVNLKEASTLTGSGLDVGGRVIYDDAFASLRYANPLRMGSRQITTTGSAEAFVVKTGNAADTTNPWGYTFTPDSGDVATSFWQLPTRVISAQVPVRSAVLSDINALEEAIVSDIALEFSTYEAQSMVSNDDQSGTTTTTTGGEDGLRGLNSYPSGTTAAFGSNGSAMTDGLHTVATVTQAGASIAYNDIVALTSALPAQYWALPGTAFHMHPSTILALRELKDNSGMPLFLEIGERDGAAVGNIFGFPVIPNPYMDEIGTGNFSIYLANWDRFLTIADYPEMLIKRFDQTAPGFVTLYAEKRLLSTVRDVFAGVRLTK